MAKKLVQIEIDTLKLLAFGHSDKAIGRMLSTTTYAIKMRLKSIRKKTGLSNRTQMAVWAISIGLVPLESITLDTLAGRPSQSAWALSEQAACVSNACALQETP